MNKFQGKGGAKRLFGVLISNRGKVIVISNFISLLSELKRQGVNLNQLTRRINQFSPTTEQEIMTTLQQCQNTFRQLCELSEQLGV